MLDGLPLFVLGLAVLIFAAELVVRGGSRLALALGVKPLVLGLTVVAMGTSAPELAVGITASLDGSGALAVGNIAGTNMVNLLFILGLSAAIRPLPLHRQTIKLDLPMMLFAALLMTLLAWDGVLSRLDGMLMLACAVVYTRMLIKVARIDGGGIKGEYKEMYGATGSRTAPGMPPLYAHARLAAMLAIGIILSVLGANWLVDGAVTIARRAAIPEAIIGLTIVAIGTSAPELVTTIVATLRDERDVAIGNLLGSSVYNILVILGLTCLVPARGIPVERELLLFDIPLMTGVAIACIPVFITGRHVSRLEGGLFLVTYFGYLAYLIAFRTQGA